MFVSLSEPARRPLAPHLALPSRVLAARRGNHCSSRLRCGYRSLRSLALRSESIGCSMRSSPLVPRGDPFRVVEQNEVLLLEQMITDKFSKDDLCKLQD
ncbi:MAG TPA: hypothetical protein VHL30_00015 [Chlamydiales bacterium]|jgi:hypothetical protein|nr:hypothetical protein [Chlamydiales bacterium]